LGSENKKQNLALECGLDPRNSRSPRPGPEFGQKIAEETEWIKPEKKSISTPSLK
jgi:hypothetical protein